MGAKYLPPRYHYNLCCSRQVRSVSQGVATRARRFRPGRWRRTRFACPCTGLPAAPTFPVKPTQSIAPSLIETYAYLVDAFQLEEPPIGSDELGKMFANMLREAADLSEREVADRPLAVLPTRILANEARYKALAIDQAIAAGEFGWATLLVALR